MFVIDQKHLKFGQNDVRIMNEVKIFLGYFGLSPKQVPPPIGTPN